METVRHLRNVCKFLPDYTASYGRTLRSLSELFIVRHAANIYEINKTLRPSPEQICTARSITSSRHVTSRHVRQHGKYMKCTSLQRCHSLFQIAFLSSLFFFSKLRMDSSREISFTRLRLVYLTTPSVASLYDNGGQRNGKDFKGSDHGLMPALARRD